MMLGKIARAMATLIGLLVASGGGYVLYRNILPAPAIRDFKAEYTALAERGLTPDEIASGVEFNRLMAQAGAELEAVDEATMLRTRRELPREEGGGTDFLILHFGAMAFRPEEAGAGEGLADHAEHDRAIAELEAGGFFERARRAAGAGTAAPELDEGALLAAQPSHSLGEASRVANALLYRGARALERGALEVARESFADAAGLARVVGQKPGVSECLISISIRRNLLGAIQAGAAIHAGDDAKLRVFEEAVDALEPVLDLRSAVERERLMMLEFAQWLIVGQPDIDGGLLGARPRPGHPWLMKAVTTPAEADAAINGYFDQLEVTAMLPRDQRPAAFAELERRGLSAPRGTPLAMMTESFGAWLRSVDAYEVALAITRAMIAVERFRAAKGALPESLEALVPEFLPELPRDVIAPNGRFVYRVAADGATYALYSVGLDQVDDGGVHDEKHESLTREKPGYDYVVMPRPTWE